MTAPASASLSRPAVENSGDGNDPSITSAAYNRMKPRWEKCRACFIGTEAIRDGGTDYLPQYSAESDEDYDVRKVLAAFYNGYARTVLASVGMLLDEEPTFGEDMPEEIVSLAENIDAAGTHITVFSRRLATAGIVDSYAGIMVEHSRPGGPGVDMSKASAAAAIAVKEGKQIDGSDEKLLGLRPYFLLFRIDDVIRTLYATVNGVKTLVLLILREVVSERIGAFGTKTVTQYRIYTNDNGVIRYELWRSPDTQGGRPTKTEGPLKITNQTEIPWSPFVAGEEIAQDEWKPPLLDLADLNIQYHISLSNHLSLESLAYVPTPVRIGARPDKDGIYPDMTLGPRNTIEAPQIDGVAEPIYWLSPPVDVLEAGEKTLAATKADMGTMGAAFLSAETRAAETAEGKRIDSAASRATLKTVSRGLKDCLERAFGLMANYLAVDGGSVTLNDNFTGEGIDPVLAGVVIQAYQADPPLLTAEETRHFLHTGQLPETFSADDLTQLFAEQVAKADQQRAEAELLAQQQKANAPPPPPAP